MFILSFSISLSHSSQTNYHLSLATCIHPIYFAWFYGVGNFVHEMALLDLDKIIIKRTIVGIRCTSCGGNLVAVTKKSLTGRFIKLISFGTVKPKNFECENCKKRHLLL